MAKFKVGDRVTIETLWHGIYLQKGNISIMNNDGSIQVTTDSGSVQWVVPRQCRRLVKKKKPEEQSFKIGDVVDNGIFVGKISQIRDEFITIELGLLVITTHRDNCKLVTKVDEVSDYQAALTRSSRDKRVFALQDKVNELESKLRVIDKCFAGSIEKLISRITNIENGFEVIGKHYAETNIRIDNLQQKKYFSFRLR